MGHVIVDSQILGVLKAYISDTEARTQNCVADTRAAGGRTCNLIAEEVVRRRRRVEELRRQYEACCGQEDADCSELWRQLAKAERLLEIGIRAQTKATEALAKYSAQSSVVVQQMGFFAIAGKQTLAKLSKNLDDYSAFSNFVAASLLTGNGTGQPTSNGSTGESTKLQSTGQTHENRVMGGRAVKVFDAPEKTARTAVFNQGSAAPGKITGTCGLCASGTIIRIAGGTATEANLITYAVTNGLCSINSNDPTRRGSTSSNARAAILTGHGVPSTSYIGKSSDDLALAVEEGRGVIISVHPYLLDEDRYASSYPLSIQIGHAVVLQSVVRDATTDEIVGFYVFDSNGRSAQDTCLYVSASQLSKAYGFRGMQSLITDYIIW